MDVIYWYVILLRVYYFKIQNDPPIVDCDLFEGQGLDSVNVKLLPLSLVKDKHYSFDECYLSYYCRFMTLLVSMHPLSGVKRDMHVELDFDFCEG